MLCRFVVVNVRLWMRLTSNLAVSSSTSAVSGDDMDGLRFDDESASSDEACISTNLICFALSAGPAMLHRSNIAFYARHQAESLT